MLFCRQLKKWRFWIMFDVAKFADELDKNIDMMEG